MNIYTEKNGFRNSFHSEITCKFHKLSDTILQRHVYVADCKLQLDDNPNDRHAWNN